MKVTTPDWLAQHDGELRLGKDGTSYSVYIGGELRYVVLPVPAKGKHACRVTETVNGRRLESGATYATAEEAVRGGLEDLRKALGW
jgi:hypothetical protein